MTSMETTPLPSLDTESMRLMPASPAIFSSIRRTTASSISAGDAPEYVVLMVILSAEVSGKTSTFMVRPVTTPANIKNIMRRFAATWLSANQAMADFMAGHPQKQRFERSCRW